MDSTVKQSLLWRSKLNHVDMFKSRVKRAVLTDCEVSECVVIGTEFKGMRLRFGVWKHGRLVGRVGEGEVVFEEMDVSPLYLWSVGGEGGGRGGGGGVGGWVYSYGYIPKQGHKDKAVAAAAQAKVEKLDYKVLQDESESEEEDESTASDEEAERPPPYAP